MLHNEHIKDVQRGSKLPGQFLRLGERNCRFGGMPCCQAAAMSQKVIEAERDFNDWWESDLENFGSSVPSLEPPNPFGDQQELVRELVNIPKELRRAWSDGFEAACWERAQVMLAQHTFDIACRVLPPECTHSGLAPHCTCGVCHACASLKGRLEVSVNHGGALLTQRTDCDLPVPSRGYFRIPADDRHPGGSRLCVRLRHDLIPNAPEIKEERHSVKVRVLLTPTRAMPEGAHSRSSLLRMKVNWPAGGSAAALIEIPRRFAGDSSVTAAAESKRNVAGQERPFDVPLSAVLRCLIQAESLTTSDEESEALQLWLTACRLRCPCVLDEASGSLRREEMSFDSAATDVFKATVKENSATKQAIMNSLECWIALTGAPKQQFTTIKEQQISMRREMMKILVPGCRTRQHASEDLVNLSNRERLRGVTEVFEMLAGVFAAAMRARAFPGSSGPKVASRRVTSLGAVCQRALQQALREGMTNVKKTLGSEWTCAEQRTDVPDLSGAPNYCLWQTADTQDSTSFLRMTWLAHEYTCPGCGGTEAPCQRCRSQTLAELHHLFPDDDAEKRDKQALHLSPGGQSYIMMADSENHRSDLRRELRAAMLGFSSATCFTETFAQERLLRVVALFALARLRALISKFMVKELHAADAPSQLNPAEPPPQALALNVDFHSALSARLATTVRTLVQEAQALTRERESMPGTDYIQDGENTHEKTPEKTWLLSQHVRWAPSALKYEGDVLEAVLAVLQLLDSEQGRRLQVQHMVPEKAVEAFAVVRVEGSDVKLRAEQWLLEVEKTVKVRPAGYEYLRKLISEGGAIRLSLLNSQRFHSLFRDEIRLRFQDWHIGEKVFFKEKDDGKIIFAWLTGKAKALLENTVGLVDLLECGARVPRAGDMCRSKDMPKGQDGYANEKKWLTIQGITHLEVRAADVTQQGWKYQWIPIGNLSRTPHGEDVGRWSPLAYVSACVNESEAEVNIQLCGGSVCVPMQTAPMPSSDALRNDLWSVGSHVQLAGTECGTTYFILGGVKLRLQGVRGEIESERTRAGAELPREGSWIMYAGAWRRVVSIASIEVRSVEQTEILWKSPANLISRPAPESLSPNVWRLGWRLLANGIMSFLPQQVLAHQLDLNELDGEDDVAEDSFRAEQGLAWHKSICGELGRKCVTHASLTTSTGHTQRSGQIGRAMAAFAARSSAAPVDPITGELVQGSFISYASEGLLSANFHALGPERPAEGVLQVIGFVREYNGTSYEDSAPSPNLNRLYQQGLCWQSTSVHRPRPEPGIGNCKNLIPRNDLQEISTKLSLDSLVSRDQQGRARGWVPAGAVLAYFRGVSPVDIDDRFRAPWAGYIVAWTHDRGRHAVALSVLQSWQDGLKVV